MSPVQFSTVSKMKVGQLKLAHKVVDFVDQANGNVFFSLMQYNMNKPEGSFAPKFF